MCCKCCVHFKWRKTNHYVVKCIEKLEKFKVERVGMGYGMKSHTLIRARDSFATAYSRVIRLEIHITIYLAIIKTVKITTLIVKIKIEIIIGDKWGEGHKNKDSIIMV